MILITGASGLIGSAVCAKLKTCGESVVTAGRSPSNDFFCNLSSSSPHLIEAVSHVPRVVVHCAADVPGQSEKADDLLSGYNTRVIDQTVLAAVRHWQCDVVYMSGCSLYCRTSTTTVTEDTPFATEYTSSYLRAKYFGDRLFSDYSRATVVRISTPVGPGISPGSALGRFIDAARSGRPIQLWGYGSREQDYVDVEDIAALVAIAIARQNFGPVNVSSGRPVTMREIAEIVRSFFPSSTINTLPIVDPNAGLYSRYSNNRARTLFGWSPLTQLRTSVERTLFGC